ncbi:MAG: hypothetical protein WBM50_15840 [Acidimicrobiales bacterium]
MAATIWLGLRQRTVVVNKRYHPDRPDETAGPVRCRSGAVSTGAALPDHRHRPIERSSPEARHRAEYRWLAAASGHPVTVLADVDFGRRTTVTRFAGSETAFSRLRPPSETARLLGAVAAALGALHRHHLVHGNLAGDHIIVNGPRFVLCSPSGLVEDPAADVMAFGPIIAVLCGRWQASGRSGPDTLTAWQEIASAALEPSMSADRLGTRLLGLARRSDRPSRHRWRRAGAGRATSSV